MGEIKQVSGVGSLLCEHIIPPHDILKIMGHAFDLAMSELKKKVHPLLIDDIEIISTSHSHVLGQESVLYCSCMIVYKTKT